MIVTFVRATDMSIDDFIEFMQDLNGSTNASAAPQQEEVTVPESPTKEETNNE